ncbi:MAG: DNA metabolism protein [Lachnospiraceae bacterium]|jgi:probable DNA metabolism protein|nr:DNA metabolism protein [Lachnospiraceae bacterium]
MIHYPNLIYTYDGSYEGLLSCVFESFLHKEIPVDIQIEGDAQLSLTPLHRIATNEAYAARVARALPQKLGPDVAAFFQFAFLTCLSGKELYMLRFLHLAFQRGPAVLNMLTDNTVHVLSKAVQTLHNETHFFKQFIRFSDYHSFLVTVIHPNNFVLPLLQSHFCDRFRHESFLIYDETHAMALFYQPGHPQIMPLQELFLEAPTPAEQKYRALWQTYYDTVAIKARYNPKCRMNHMPKRYWKYMTEFGAAGIARYEAKPAPARAPHTEKLQSLPLVP